MTDKDPSATGLRDAALERVARINRWSIAGAVGLSLALSALAQAAFHGRTLSNAAAGAGTQAPLPSGGQGAAGASPQINSGAGQGIGAPAQAPLPTQAAPVVVSGGS
jgi:hypothetical protein